MIENYVHWNEDIGEWQLVGLLCISHCGFQFKMDINLKLNTLKNSLCRVCLWTVPFCRSEMCGIHWQQYEKTNPCSRQKRKRCELFLSLCKDRCSRYVSLFPPWQCIVDLSLFLCACLLQPFEVDLSHVYLAYTEESMRQSLMKLERPRTSKSGKSGRPKTGRR